MGTQDKIIQVTRPSLPDLGEFQTMLEEIWRSKWITNQGNFHQQLEEELRIHLGVPYLSLFSNGTLALVTALQALDLEGEVITTPFSFVATSHALWWNKITPVFVDIDPSNGNLDPAKIEAAITENTSAILPVHVYGNPCENEAIQSIADKHGLKVIYDAAHAFGVKQAGDSILNHGELSILSFHATKVFNTIEGGAIISHTQEMKTRIDRLKNFGFVDEVTVSEPGINAKLNELQAAYGLLQLNTIDSEIASCKTIASQYRSELSGIKGISFMMELESVDYNYSYFPIFFDSSFSATRDEVYDHLRAKNIMSRRYFYPLISSFDPYCTLPSASVKNLPAAHQYASRVLCLPIYADLKDEELLRVCQAIKDLI